MAFAVEDAIRRIDAERIKRVGQMLVTDAPAELANVETALFDVTSMSGAAVVEDYHKRYAKYATAPFDPEAKKLAFYPGGITIWSGYPGAGKTTLLRQLVCHTLARGSSIFVASLEEDPRDVLIRLASTAWGVPIEEIDGHRMQCFIDAYAERLRVWGVIGTTSHLKLLAVIQQLAEKGIRHMMIDSLMKLDVSNDDLDQQRRFVNTLDAVTRKGQCHTHLVAHPRKLAAQGQELDINDVAGARELVGAVDNVLFVKRTTDKKNYNSQAESTPMAVAIRKQRHGSGALDEVGGWFNRKHRQFHTDQFAEPNKYLPDWAYDRA